MNGVLKCSVALLFLTVVGYLAGCASDKKPPAAAAQAPKVEPASLADIKTELLASKTQINATNDALNKLHKSTAADAQANYNTFTEEFLKLKDQADKVKARAEDLKARSNAYHAMWSGQSTVENPELRSQALKQKGEAERVYNNIASEMELARLSFNPYVTNLRDVGNYLNGHLSPASLNSVSDLVVKANGQAKEVNGHLDAIVKSVDELAAKTGESVAAPK